MMKRALAGLLALLGSGSETPADAPVRHANPRDILFSMSTISNDAAPLEAFSGKVGAQDLTFHEDEWRQIEFFPKERLGEIERMLTELKTFEMAHRKRMGWDEIYVRKLAVTPVLAGGHALRSLEKTLGAKATAAPIVYTGAHTLVGRLAGGFSLPLGGRVTLYGITDDTGVPVLGANLNAPADNQVLVRAFAKLGARHHLILVDWRAETVLISVSADGRVSSFAP
jgi:hypothetical protein